MSTIQKVVKRIKEIRESTESFLLESESMLAKQERQLQTLVSEHIKNLENFFIGSKWYVNIEDLEDIEDRDDTRLYLSSSYKSFKAFKEKFPEIPDGTYTVYKNDVRYELCLHANDICIYSLYLEYIIKNLQLTLDFVVAQKDIRKIRAEVNRRLSRIDAVKGAIQQLVTQREET